MLYVTKNIVLTFSVKRQVCQHLEQVRKKATRYFKQVVKNLKFDPYIGLGHILYKHGWKYSLDNNLKL